MQQNDYIRMIGSPFKTLVKEFHLPDLEASAFTPAHCSTIRNLMSAIPGDDQRLIKHMVALIRQGTVEEMQQDEGHLVLLISFIHKGEKYHAELKLEQFEWQLMSIEYTGESAPGKGKLIAIFTAALAVLTLFSLFFFTDLSGSIKRVNTALFSDKLESSPEVLPIDEESEIDLPVQSELDEEDLVRLAAQYDYALISEEEYRALLAKIEELYEREENRQQSQIDMEEAQSEAEEELGNVTIQVYPGMSAWSIARQLEELGVAEDARELQRMFATQEIAYRIRTGQYTIPQNATYEEIIDLFRLGPN